MSSGWQSDHSCPGGWGGVTPQSQAWSSLVDFSLKPKQIPPGQGIALLCCREGEDNLEATCAFSLEKAMKLPFAFKHSGIPSLEGLEIPKAAISFHKSPRGCGEYLGLSQGPGLAGDGRRLYDMVRVRCTVIHADFHCTLSRTQPCLRKLTPKTQSYSPHLSRGNEQQRNWPGSVACHPLHLPLQNTDSSQLYLP